MAVEIEYQGEKHSIKEWAMIKGLCYSTLYSRYYKGKTGEELFAPTEKVYDEQAIAEKKLYWAEYMRKYRADPINKERIREQQKKCYYAHHEARLEHRHKVKVRKAIAEIENKANKPL